MTSEQVSYGKPYKEEKRMYAYSVNNKNTCMCTIYYEIDPPKKIHITALKISPL